mgnify:CR=1 FL=1
MNKLALLEAALFMAEEPLTLEQLARLLELSREEVRKLLAELERRYSSEEHGIELLKLNGYKLSIKAQYAPKVAKLARRSELSRGLLRALSLIAYYEPMKQSDLVRAIGNRAYQYVRKLVELGFVRAEKHSRTKLLRTTRYFREYFGLKGSDLKLRSRGEHEV